jgi:FkbM family methyltransferase
MNMEYAASHLAAFNPGREITVLQVGAYDGRTNDPVESSIRAFGWRGVLVEPQPTPFAALKRHYEDNPLVQVFNVAIGESDGTRPLYTIEPAADLPEWTRQIASFNRSHLDTQQKQLTGIDLQARIKVLDVTTWSFDTLLDRSQTAHVDILQLDAEGFDFSLLKLFDVPRRKPTIINYEHQHLSRTDRDTAAELLVACGYRLAMSYHAAGDTIAVRAL